MIYRRTLYNHLRNCFLLIVSQKNAPDFIAKKKQILFVNRWTWKTKNCKTMDLQQQGPSKRKHHCYNRLLILLAHFAVHLLGICFCFCLLSFFNRTKIASSDSCGSSSPAITDVSLIGGTTTGTPRSDSPESDNNSAMSYTDNNNSLTDIFVS